MYNSRLFNPYRSKSFTVIRGKRWYYRLILKEYDGDSLNQKQPELRYPRRGYFRCLTDEYPQEVLENKIVIGFESIKEDGKHSRMFAVFDSYIELFLYQEKIPLERKNFYEIINGEFPQKPHFDVDIKQKEIPPGEDINALAEAIKDNLIESVIKICNDKGVKLDIPKDILLYQSHSHDLEKRSFHLVIHHYCHTDHHQALAFYQSTTSQMKEKYAKYVDHSVYSSKQNFRLFGHQKLGSGRPKFFQTPMMFRGDLITHVFDVDFDENVEKAENLLKLETLKESLVSWVKDCEYLPSFQDEKERIKKRSYEDLGDLSPETVKEAEVLLGRDDFPFVVRDIKGSIISLRRLRPSFCEICDRVHEHENPYLLVVAENVYFCCRRNPDKKLLLGEVKNNITTISELLEEGSEGSEDGCHLELGGYIPKTLLEGSSPKTSKNIVEPRDVFDVLKQSNLIVEGQIVDTIAEERRLIGRDRVSNRKDRKFILELPDI